MPTVRFAARAGPMAPKPAAAPSAPPAAVRRNVRRDTEDERIEAAPLGWRAASRGPLSGSLAIAMPCVPSRAGPRYAIGTFPFKSMKMQKSTETTSAAPVPMARRLFSMQRFVCISRVVYSYASDCMHCVLWRILYAPLCMHGAPNLYSGAQNEAVDAVSEGRFDQNGACQFAQVDKVGVDAAIGREDLQQAPLGGGLERFFRQQDRQRTLEAARIERLIVHRPR